MTIKQHSQESYEIKIVKKLNSKSVDITGKRFNKLIAVAYKHHNKYNQQCWLFKCDCGNEIIVEKRRVVRKQLSCGCLSSRKKVTHNYSKTPIYKVWEMIKQRCNNKKNKRYINYGGRGISLCEEWDKFENFLEDMGERPSAKHSIDRIDNNGNYEPSNCRWTTRKEQDNNRSNTILFKIGNKKQCLSSWCRDYNIDYNKAFRMAKKSFTINKIINELSCSKAKNG